MRTATLAALLLLTGVAAGSAQDAPTATSSAPLSSRPTPAPAVTPELPDFIETVEVEVVEVDVVVTDRDGKPIGGLGREDFEVLEDGKPVELVNFLAYAAADAAGVEDADAAAGGEAPPLDLIVVVDEGHLRPESRQLVLPELRRHLGEHLSGGGRVMVAAIGGATRILQPLTREPAAVSAALDGLQQGLGSAAGVEGERRRFMMRVRNTATPDAGEGQQFDGLSPGGGESIDSPFEDAVLTALQLRREAGLLAERQLVEVRRSLEELKRLCGFLAGVPGRKALLYVSDGLPVRPEEVLLEAWRARFGDWFLRNEASVQGTDRRDLSDAAIGTSGLGRDATHEMAALTAEAGAARVVVYSWSTGRGTTPVLAEAPSAGGGSFAVAAAVQGALEEPLLRLADATGGTAHTNARDLGGLMTRVATDFSTYYSLGYQPPPGRAPGRHQVEVRVRRPGSKVRHLEAYRQRDPMEKLADLALSALHLDLVDNPLGVRLEPGDPTAAGRDVFQVPIMVKIPFEKILLMPESEAHTGRLSLLVVAADERGGVSPVQRIELPLHIPNQGLLRTLAGAAAYPLALQMRGGRQRVAVAVRDRVSGVQSIVTLQLEVGGS